MHIIRNLAYITGVLLCVTALVWLVAKRPDQGRYEVRGTFHFGLHGQENASLSFQECSGSDLLIAFKEHRWANRPQNFDDRVLRRLHTVYGRIGNDEAAVEALKTITFHHSRKAYSWCEMAVASPDSFLAADVVNASMEVFAEVDLEQEEEKKSKILKTLEVSFRRAVENRERDMQRINEDMTDEQRDEITKSIARHDKAIKTFREQIDQCKKMDASTNTMFKVMIRAEAAAAVPINVAKLAGGS